MTSPLAIREALAAYITSSIPGLRGQTDPGTIANPPVAVVLPAQGSYIDYAVVQSRTSYNVRIRVVLLISRASERAGYEQLDEYLAPYGATSLAAAILANTTLSGACDYCVPMQATGPTPITWAGIEYFGAEIICEAAAD